VAETTLFQDLAQQVKNGLLAKQIYEYIGGFFDREVIRLLEEEEGTPEEVVHRARALLALKRRLKTDMAMGEAAEAALKKTGGEHGSD